MSENAATARAKITPEAPEKGGEAEVELLTAYRLPGEHSLKIVPAPADREWIDVTTDGWANRCLPLRIANQAGWLILNDCDFEVVWGGKPGVESLKILTKSGAPKPAVHSMFGFGVVTWTIPYLFRTPPGFNLQVRGPANLPKDGASAMDAIVETDWLPYSFTMNWRLMRPLKVVKFQKDEPICMITPVRRYELERFQPEIRNLESQPELLASYNKWHENRTLAKKAADARMAAKDPEKPKDSSKQGHYIRGEGHLGERAQEHQNKLKVQGFVEKEAALRVEPVASEAPLQRSILQRWLGK